MRWLIILVFLTCCTGENRSRTRLWMRKDNRIKVLSTIGMISDLVEEIGGEHVDVLTLIPPGLDPHSYQMVKGDDEKLAFADLIFYNGLGLEHGPSLLQTLANTPRAIPIGDHIQKKIPRKILTYDGQPDPHIWMDISLWSYAVPIITTALSNADPDNRAEYEKRGKLFINAMRKAHREVRTQLQTIPDPYRFLVTSHDAFNYFTRAYLATKEEQSNGWQKRFVAPEGLSPESQLSTSDIQETLQHILQFDIFVIFPESNVSQASLRKLLDSASQMGLKLEISTQPLYGDAMGLPGSNADTYLKMIKANADILTKQLNAMENANGTRTRDF
ncbi:MAG: zinc ABC transporter substrate-binding protein [Waddliaceae bacterium]